MDFSPVVLFAYNRPVHIKKVLDALAHNLEAKSSDLYIYCDGPKSENDIDNINKIDQVIAVAKAEQRFEKVNVIVQEKNKGLADSIVDGVTQIINKYGKIIVLEDDIVVSKGFLKYMNDALDFYENNEKVMHVSGYMYPHKESLPETFFFNVPLCWGWATWSRSWKYFNPNSIDLWRKIKEKKWLSKLDKFGFDYLSSQLAHNISGKLNTWFVKWHASVLLQNGFTLYPKQSLVENIGFDNSGVHNGIHTEFTNGSLANNIKIHAIDLVENEKAGIAIRDFYTAIKQSPKKKSFKKIFKNKIRNSVFLVFPDLKNALKANQQVLQTNVYLGKICKIYAPSRLSDTIIGNYTYISENSVVNNCIIGKFCSIGANFMAGRGIHPTHGISTHPMFYSTAKQNGTTLSVKNKIEELKQITIGNDVFIGMNVTILDGVTIGDGAIIGAGAVVSKDIPSYAIAVGNPVKVIKYRFEEDIIERLQTIKWWEFKDEDLYLVEKHFFTIEAFIKTVEEKEVN